jgi:hypothetical protein
MPTRPKTQRASDLALEPVDWLSRAEHRRIQAALRTIEKERAGEQKNRALAIAELRSEYRERISALLGPDGSRRYKALRARAAKAPRARRTRDATALLHEIGFDRIRAQRIQKKYLESVKALLGDGTFSSPSDVLDAGRSPWVTYAAPYTGSFWSYAWDRSGNVRDPVLARYLDTATGRIGSSIETYLGGADNDDRLAAEYYTCFYAWHTALANGPLDAYLTFRFRTSTYSGEVHDEWGLSDVVYNQWARVRFRVVNTAGRRDSQDSRLFNVTGAASGDDESWNDVVAAPNDVRSFYFRTPGSFNQGEPLLLEAGVLNTTWFTSNDMSIETADDLDLRLDRIMVRSP